MIITRARWCDIEDGTLIVGPSGRVYVLIAKTVDAQGRPFVQLGDPNTAHLGVECVATPYVDVYAETEIVSTAPDLESAVETLSRFFALERVKP